jgi:hypothetical protein
LVVAEHLDTRRHHGRYSFHEQAARLVGVPQRDDVADPRTAQPGHDKPIAGNKGGLHARTLDRDPPRPGESGRHEGGKGRGGARPHLPRDSSGAGPARRTAGAGPRIR